MSKFLNYKGWQGRSEERQGTCEWSEEDQVYHGKISGTTDLVTYECDSLWNIEKVFKEAVDDWLKDREKHFG